MAPAVPWTRWLGAVLACALTLAAAGPARAHDEARIVVRKFRVLGNTELSPAVIQQTLRPFVGKSLSIKDLKAAARKLRDAYRQRGYLMAYAYVPPQEFRNDTVELRVQQGKYGKLKVEGNRYYSDEFIERFFAPARSARYVIGRTMEHALLVLNQNLDLRVQSVLEARKDGSIDVTLKVTDRLPLHVILDYDNFGARLVGRNRAGAAITWGNALVEGDLLAVKVADPFEVKGEQPFYFGSYGIPVGHMGTRLEASYSHARTFIGKELAALGISGEATIGSLRLSTFDRLDLRHTEVWYYEFTAKDVENTALGGAVSVSDDEIRTVGLGHRGSATSRDGKWQVGHNYELIGGLGPLLGGSKAASATSRVGADDGFGRATMEVVATHQLSKKGVALARVSGQLATSRVLVAEEYALGGPDSVRGYQQGEILGDDGYAVTAEYRHAVHQGRRSQLQALGFLDHGAAGIRHPLKGEKASQDLTAAGVGLRGQLGPGLTMRADLGFCIDPTFNADKDKAKLFVQTSYRF